MANDGTHVDIYEAVINDLKAKIASLQMTVDNLENVRGMTSALTAVSAVQPLTRIGNSIEFGHDAFFGLSIPEAAKKYLGAIKKTLPVSAITETLVKGGLKSAATNMKENVRTILGRHPDFVRINGEFGLAEWYPSRRAAQKKRWVGLLEDSDQTAEDVSPNAGTINAESDLSSEPQPLSPQ